MQKTATVGQRSGEGHTLDIFGDRSVTGEEVRLFGILCRLALGSRGCVVPRTVLARMLERSVSSIDHQLSSLKRRGYITITRKGRQPGSPGIIRVVRETQEESGFTTKRGRRQR